MNNTVRIIAGSLRGRKIHFHPGKGLRPTLDVIRETLFNWLMLDIQGARCLDLFAGTGALGIEALSRGAAHVTFVEERPEAVKDLEANLRELKIADKAHVLQGNALAYPCEGAYDLIFLDPPFHHGLLQQALAAIVANQCLATGGRVYVEAERALDTALVLGQSWQFYRHKKTGEVQYGLLLVT